MSQNILIHREPSKDGTWWVVLGDLGLSRRSGASSGTTTIHGTPSFMAPETIGKPFMGLPRDANSFSADMWCLGESIACALTGQTTFSDSEHLLRYQNHEASFPDNVLKNLSVSVDAIDFIRSLMEVEPLRRLTAEQALNHPWIKVDHVSNTHTSDTAVAIAASSTRSNTQVFMETSNGELVAPEKRKLYTHDQTTQASAQWTQTMPMLSEDTQASATWTKTVADPALSRNSPDLLDHPTVRQHSTEDTTAQAKEVPASGQTARSASSNKAESALSQGDRKLKVKGKQLPFIIPEQYLLDSFKAFSAAEKLRMSERQRTLSRENKSIRIADLKKFGQNFRLNTPVPSDLIPILSNNEDKQRQIEASSRQRASTNDLETAEKQDSTPTALQKEQNSAPITAKKTSQRQLYGNAALPPAPSPGARPPPAALRPPPARMSNSGLSSSRPRPQPQTKALSETQTQTQTRKAVQTANPSRWEEAVRRQEANAQSLFQPSKVAVAASRTVEEPQTQVLGKKKKKKRGGG
jgi:serine/threonine protein kinase